MNNTQFLGCKSAVTIYGNNLEVKNSIVHYSPYFYGDIFSIHNADTHIEGCLIYGPDDEGKTDIIDCDDINYGVIKNNTLIGTTDDGIDIGTESTNVVVSGNHVYNCASMGISVGENSNALVERNIVVNCKSGIQVHSEAVAHIDHNTLYSNDISIQCYHYSNEPNSGGHAIVTNTILSASQTAVYELFENSTISFNYSLTDTDPVMGVGNLNDDPMFVNMDELDFNLHPESPCINSGDPEYPTDLDGTRTDIGAIYFDHTSSIIEKYKDQELVIYPNPVYDQFSCSLTDNSKTINKIEIIDQQGKVVFKIEDIHQNAVELNNDFADQGLYYISVVTNKNQRINSKIVILKNNK